MHNTKRYNTHQPQGSQSIPFYVTKPAARASAKFTTGDPSSLDWGFLGNVWAEGRRPARTDLHAMRDGAYPKLNNRKMDHLQHEEVDVGRLCSLKSYAERTGLY